MASIKNLYPQSLWAYFEELTKVPRPTGYMEPVKEYLGAFCLAHALDFRCDAAGNFVVRKNAAQGCKSSQAVILQAHLDMVCQADEGAKVDFFKDPVIPYVEDGFVAAEATSLGADNGIGVAAILAVLSDKSLKHGPIEALFTVDEEVGMAGALGLDASLLKGKLLINTDFEQEGEICIGCAGGTDMDIMFQYKEGNAVPAGDIAVEVFLSGLKGGHSGVDIHLGRGNAIKLMSRFLKEAISNYGARLAGFNGGSARNAIPRSARATITIPSDNNEAFWELAGDFRDMLIDEYKGVDEICFEVSVVPLPPFLIPEFMQDDLVNALEAVHNGVLGMLHGFEGTVETSSNLGIIATCPGLIKLKFLERSCSESKRYAACSSIESLFSLVGAKVDYGTDYPEWKPYVSPFVQLAAKEYKALFGREIPLGVMHAGLECGVLSRLLPDVQIIAVGPTIISPHSPSEKVEIASVGAFWDFLVALLVKIAET